MATTIGLASPDGTCFAEGRWRHNGERAVRPGLLGHGEPPVAEPFPPGETTALAVLRDMLPAGTPPQTVGQVMDAAIVMTVAASSSGDEGFRSVAYLLDGTVVPAGSGPAAIAALQRAFQVQAAAGTGSGLDEWLKILAEAGLQVFPDADGPAGPRRRAPSPPPAFDSTRLDDRDKTP
jgi:hypothetical protein